MKQLSVITALMIGGILAWLFASRLSADALGMAVGLLFGVLAGIPTALLVIASNHRRQDENDEEELTDHYDRPYGQRYVQPPAVVVLTAPAAPAAWREQPPQTVTNNFYDQRTVNVYPGADSGTALTPQQQAETHRRVTSAPPTQGRRVFKVVGEQEEYLDEW